VQNFIGLKSWQDIKHIKLKSALPLSFSFVISLAVCNSGSGQNVLFSSEQRKAHANFRLLAWNEDSVNNIIFSIGRSNSFNYTITTHDLGKTKTNYYKGTWNKSNDTIFLYYNNSNVPISFKHFLLLESQGHYLIQRIDNYQNHIYLRIMFDPIGGRGAYRLRPWEH
jgi:hypothetical protein